MNRKNFLLLIHDNTQDSKLIESVVHQKFSKEKIIIACEPSQGLKIIESENIDIILLDTVFFEHEGLDFLSEINKVFQAKEEKKIRKPYIITCTTLENKEYRLKAFENGVMDYIIKPFTEEELAIRIKRMLEFRNLENKIYHLQSGALKDPLTGLANRKALDEEIERMAQLSTRYNMEYSVIMVDLDKFKRFNTVYGESEGDKVLSRVGKIIHKNLRKSDFGGRFGGEEFLLILPYTEETGAFTVGWRLFKDIMNEGIPHKENPPYNVATFTCGIAVREKDEDIITVIKKADEALYYGKKYHKKVISFSEIVSKKK